MHNPSPQLTYEHGIRAAQGAFSTLQQHGKTIACAESYTGGLLSALLTELPGSSQIFCGGVCTYANISKIDVLGVDAQLIADYGVVSKEVALAMAQAVRSLFRADIGIATTGIAGPDGGSERQPVGSIVWAIAHRDRAGTSQDKVFSQLLAGNRWQIRLSTAQQIFHFVQGLTW